MQEHIHRISTVCIQLLERDGTITSVKHVLDCVQDGYPHRLSHRLVYRTLKDKLGLKFKRTKPIAARTNIISCRYQR